LRLMLRGNSATDTAWRGAYIGQLVQSVHELFDAFGTALLSHSSRLLAQRRGEGVLIPGSFNGRRQVHRAEGPATSTQTHQLACVLPLQGGYTYPLAKSLCSRICLSSSRTSPAFFSCCSHAG
jgi:hypothetical protein